MVRNHKKRVFVSFDFDRDRGLKELIIGQSRNEDSPFEVENWSLKEAAPERNWEIEAESRINRSDLVIVMVGSETHRAPGVIKEVAIARRLQKPIVQVIGYRDGNYEPVPGAGRLHSWSWPN